MNTLPQLRSFSITAVRKLDLSFDCAHLLPRKWRGTALDILRVGVIPIEGRFEIVLRPGWIDDRTARRFATYWTRWALSQIASPDPRSFAALDAARCVQSEATGDVLAALREAAWQAAQEASERALASKSGGVPRPLADLAFAAKAATWVIASNPHVAASWVAWSTAHIADGFAESASIKERQILSLIELLEAAMK